jgi:hypothetical protein
LQLNAVQQSSLNRKFENMTTLHLRKSIGRPPLRLAFLLIPLAFVCFALSPEARALLPAPTPDGGYTGWNTAEGQNALFSLTTGGFNTAIGGHALYGNTTGRANTAVGAFTLAVNSFGNQNVAIGQGAERNNTTGSNNTAAGDFALYHNTSSEFNVAVGDFALAGFNGTGSFDGANTAIGSIALTAETSGEENVAVGRRALEFLLTGSNNTIVGWRAGDNYTGGESGNICIGSFVTGVTGQSNTVRIGDNLPTGAGLSRCFIGGILSHFVVQAPGNSIVTIDTTTGQLGHTTDFAAKQAAEQQKKIEEQQASIAELRSTVGVLTAQLKEQASQIQKVSAQLELNKPAPRTVANNQ